MYPYIHIGSWHIGTFGLMLWLAAVCATFILHRTFLRERVDADALTIVTYSVLAGIVGAKAWHELQDTRLLASSFHQILLPGWSHPTDILFGLLRWFQAGFAWYGGLCAGVITLIVQGVLARPNGLRGRLAALRMLDLATVAAAVGYGVGRIGCLTSGDGDYGQPTTLPWGVHMAKDALVPTPDKVHPTPIYEMLFAFVLAWLLWRLGRRALPIGLLTGLYLIFSGIGRFLVEFIRTNPHVYGFMTNAQLASLLSIIAGGLLAMMCLKNPEPNTAITTEAA